MSKIDLIIIKDKDEMEAAEVMVEGFIDNNKYRFILDTGAARTSVISDDYTCKFECIEKSSSSGLFSKNCNELIKVPKIEIGPISRTDFTIVRADNNNQLRKENLVGMDILKDYSLYFSFDEGKVIVNPEDKANFIFQELELGTKYHPYINVYFGGIETRAIWDTGAGITVVKMDFIEKNPAFF
jgi:hypothetical protein